MVFRDTILLFILLMMTTCNMADCTSSQEDERHSDSTKQERRLEDLSLTDHNDLDGAQLLKGAFTTLLEANGGKTLTPPSKQAKNSKTTTQNSEPIKKEGKETSKVKPKKKSVKAATAEKEKSDKQNKENKTPAKKSTTDSAKKEEKKVNAREEYTNMRKAEIDKYMQQKKEYAPSSTDSPEVARFKTALRECTGNERYLKQENREQNENIGRLTMDLHALDKMYKNEETGRRDCIKRENNLKKELAELQQKLGERKQQPEISCPEMHAKLQEEFRQQIANGEQALADCNKKLMTGDTAALSGTCNESDKETKILENKIKELTEENAQLKKQLSSIETQKPGKIFDKPTASRISTFSVKVADDTTSASDATATGTDEKNTKQTDSTKPAKASSTAPWQSYKEVLLLLQQTRNERDEQKRKFEECAAKRELTVHGENLATATEKLTTCEEKLGACRTFRDREDELVKPRPKLPINTLDECLEYLQFCEKATYTFRDSFDRGVDKWRDMFNEVQSLRKRCPSDATEALEECRWSLANMALDKMSPNDNLRNCAEQHLQCRRTKQYCENQRKEMSLLVSQCTEEKNKAASVSGERDCTSQVEPCKRQLALIHEHNERLKRVTRDQVWFVEKFARIATELGENRDLYRKLYFDHLRLTETIKAERENYNLAAQKCENKLEKCEERLNQGITGDGFCNEDDKEEIQYLQQEIRQLKRILVSTQGELNSCKADYTKPSNAATEKTFSTFAVDGSSNSETGKNSDAKPLRCEAERADLKVKLASAIRERDRNKRHLLLQHELGERLKASIKDRLPIVEMSTQIANDIGKERDTYWDVYYRQLRTTETIKAQRDTYNLGESQCKKKLTKLQKRLAKQEKQEIDDDQSGFCNSDDAEEIKFLRDELTQQRRLMATMNAELENYKHDYSNFKNTGKSIGTFSAHQSTSCSTDTDKKIWAAENDELKNKLAEASLKMSEYQALLERHQQQLRLQHKHAERLKAYVSEQLPFVDAFARIATELGKEKNTFHELYYTQVRLTEVIKAEKNNYERAARKWEFKFNKLAEHISKKEHSNVCQADEETISRDEHEEEIKFLREEITFQKRLLTVMKAALNAYKSDFLTGSRVGKIESFSLKDKKSDTVATGTNTNAKSTVTEPEKESDSKCSNEKISHLQSQNEELKAKLETLEDDKINCQETVSVLRKRAETAEAMHASVSNSMKVLSDSYSQWNATLEECEKEKGSLAFRNAGIDMVLTHLEDELKTKQQQWDSKSAELTKAEAHYRRMFLITMFILMATFTYMSYSWLSTRLGYSSGSTKSGQVTRHTAIATKAIATKKGKRKDT